jgi:RNA polymerase sigma factor (sigma-70 family)
MSINAKDHFGLVGSISKKYIKKGERIEDSEVFSDGLVGLTRAMERFDTSRGLQFSTFAYYCIRNEICKGLKERQKGVHSTIRIDWSDSEIDMPARSEEEPYFVKAGKIITEILKELPTNTNSEKKNKKILEDYYLDERVLREIGEDFGVCKERVRQRREKALLDLKAIAYRFRHML